MAALVLAACSGEPEEIPAPTVNPQEAPVETTTDHPVETTDHTATEDAHPPQIEQTLVDPEVIGAILATAAYQDLAAAEDDGWESSIDELGCFENPGTGGMGLHHVNGELMDDVVDATAPEALVYELDRDGEVAGLVALEYIVPVEEWAAQDPPELFAQVFHQHPVLPLWVLHAWVWKANPNGMFEDWNPAVRMCPEGVPVFGVDLP